MYYELYIDNLFFINFVMNLYLLMLVNYSVKRTATRLRMIGSAVLGAGVYCGSFFIPVVPIVINLLVGTVLVSCIMIIISFKPVSFKAFLKLMEILIGYSFFMGGGIIFVINRIGGWNSKFTGVFTILGAAGILYMLITYIYQSYQKNKSMFCKVTLLRKENFVTVRALVDTGNTLIEPISGKPVSIVNRNIAEGLWQTGLPNVFRAIPYHSIGCNKGILKGYELQEMIVEWEGVKLTFHNVYLGIAEDAVASLENYGMILNPRLLEGEHKNDIKSGYAGKLTV